MPISYVKEKQAWSMEHLTEDEMEILLELGRSKLTELIGGMLVKKLMDETPDVEALNERLLNSIPKEDMGTA